MSCQVRRTLRAIADAILVRVLNINVMFICALVILIGALSSRLHFVEA